MKPVAIDEIGNSAIRIVIRLGLGTYTIRGPAGNIFEPESRAAWSAVVNELGNEGYVMVSTEEYGAARRLAAPEVLAQVEGGGSLFALVYPAPAGTEMVVAVAREEREDLGPHLL